METKNLSSANKAYQIVLASITWFAVMFQLYLTDGSFFNFISYFTILSNILVAVSLTFSYFFAASPFGRYFSSIKVQSAIAVYIFIVGLVYNFVLRGIWSPNGWQLVVDNLLHVAVPTLYLLYWVIFVPKGLLNWKDGFVWAYFPLLYLIYSLVRGHFMGWYPYPFLAVDKIGYQKVFINSIFMVIAFIVIGFLLIGLNKMLGKKSSPTF